MTGNERMSDNAVRVVGGIINFLQLFVPLTLAKRAVSMLLLAVGIPNSRVTELTGLCERSVRSLKQAMMEEENPADLLKIKDGSGRKSKLADIEAEILKELEENNYHSRQQIADMILEKFQIQVSVSAVGKLLKKNGIKKLKSGSLPAKADVVAQREFYDNTLRPLMEKAKAGTVALLFMDAAHFVMGCDFLGYIYCKTRRFIRTWCGRKRYNVLGALDFVTKKVLRVSNDSYITAKQVCEMLRLIAREYAGKTVHVVLDNAKYQKCQDVLELAARLNIRLEYIPPYSPNLNLIERFWKFVKGELRSKYYDVFSLFCQKIDSVIQNDTPTHKAKMEILIGEKVQIFDSFSFLAEDTFTCSMDKIHNVA